MLTETRYPPLLSPRPGESRTVPAFLRRHRTRDCTSRSTRGALAVVPAEKPAGLVGDGRSWSGKVLPTKKPDRPTEGRRSGCSTHLPGVGRAPRRARLDRGDHVFKPAGRVPTRGRACFADFYYWFKGSAGRDVTVEVRTRKGTGGLHNQLLRPSAAPQGPPPRRFRQPPAAAGGQGRSGGGGGLAAEGRIRRRAAAPGSLFFFSSHS